MQRVYQRPLGQRLQWDAPEIGLRVQHIEPARLLDCLAEVNPFTKLPIVVAARRSVRAGKRDDNLAVRFRARAAEDCDLVAQPPQFARQQPGPSLDAAAGVRADRRRKGGDQGDAQWVK